jgi:hypothetical protein
MNSRYPTLDIRHQRNHQYDPSTLESETCWSREVIDKWMAECPDTIAEKVRETLSGAGTKCIGERIAGTRPIDSKAIQNLALGLGALQPDVQWEHIEVSVRYWRSKADLNERLNCPHCKVPDTNDHYRHYCVEPTVVAARQKHLDLLTTAIYTCKLKPTTARALTSMYTIDNDGRHIDPGARSRDECADLVENLIATIPAVAPARGALIALLEMGPSERTQGWFPKQFDHGMYLLGEPLEKVRIFQSHVVRLAMEAGMWAARCRLIHPGGTTGLSSRKAASDEYAAELKRTKRRHLPITKRAYLGLPARARRIYLRQWEFAFLTPTEGPLLAWAIRTERPANPTPGERREKRKATEAAMRTKVQVAPAPVRALRIKERKRQRSGVQMVTPRPPPAGGPVGKKPTPPRAARSAPADAATPQARTR